MIERLDFQIAILKRSNEANRINGTNTRLPDSEEMREMIGKEIFESQWKKNCSI